MQSLFSPMQLKSYEFVEFIFKINEKAKTAEKFTYDINFNFNFRQNSKNIRDVRLQIDLDLRGNTPSNPLRMIKCKTYGYFHFDENVSEELIPKLIVSSGISMLFSTIRTHIFQVTCTSRIGLQLIPTLDINAILKNKKKENEKNEKVTSKKKELAKNTK